MNRKRVTCALPGGASHVATIGGFATALDARADVVAWAGVSAGFLVALLAAFGELPKLPALLIRMLSNDRVLDVWPDGKIGMCRWEVIPALVDKVLGAKAKMGDSLVPLVGVVTSADTGRPVYLSSWATPRVLCREVARASSAIFPLAPMVTIPSLGTTRSPDIRLHCDGGFTDNLPDAALDHIHEPCVSLSLEHDNATRVRDDDPLAQALAVLRAVSFAPAQRKSLRRDGIHLTVGAVGSGLNFDLSPGETMERFTRGRAVVRDAAALFE